ncbi:MAG: nucleotidyltransferase family protein [Geminicoccaceae bacterium]
MIRSPGIEWARVLGQASAQLVLPALAAALRDLDLIGSLDAELGAFLLAVHAANVERNDELRDELAAAVGVLNRAGIEPVLLKGAIRLVDRLYPDHGWRMLRDLDLLVPEAKLAEAIGAFEQAGYARADPGSNELRRRPGLAQIDLHRELFPTPRQAGLLPAAEIFDGSRPAAFRGGRVRLPAIEHQLVHLIGHRQIRHFGHASGRITLGDRLEAAALLRWTAESIDWQAVSARFVAVGYRRPLLTFLLALHDGGWCAAPVPGRIDLLTALQRRRIALQARSTTFAYIGGLTGWWASELKSQIEARDGGQRKAIRNLRSLIFERGAVWRMARAFLDRRWDVMHALAHLSWIVAR